MTEREVFLEHKPKENPEQALSTTERLAFAYSAKKDFSLALEKADSIPENYNNEKAYAYIYIGRLLAQNNIDYRSVITRLSDIVISLNPEHHTDHIHKGITQIHLDAGDFDAADKSFGDFPQKRPDKYFYLDRAKARAKFGQNPQPDLLKFLAETERCEAENPENSYDSMHSYGDLALAHFQTTEEYPEVYLNKAEERLKEHRKKYSDDPMSRSILCSKLSEIYASCGNFEKALKLTTEIRRHGHADEFKVGALKHIMQEQFAKNLFQDAIKTGDQILEIIKAMKNDHRKPMYMTVETAKINAFLGKAYAHDGIDPSPCLQKALEIVLQIPYNGSWKMEALNEIAKSKSESNINPEPELLSALKELDDIPYDGYIDSAQQLMGYEDLAKFAAELGYIDLARIALSRLENFQEYDIKDYEAEVLASIASSEAQKGLSSAEIDNLPKEKIQSILLGKDESAKQAVLYFGLDKKLV